MGGAGALTIDNNSASSNTKFDITGGAAVDNFEGSDGNDTLKGLGAADVLSGGGGNDMFVYDTDDNLVTGNAFIDQISGGTGTDSIVIDPEAGDAAFVIAATDSFARVTGVTTIAAKTLCDEDITISLIDDSGINTIDLSADTDTTGTNTVDVSAEDTAGFTIIGAANATADVITDSAVDDTIIGLAGADDISIATGGDDIIKFNAIGDVGDVIDGFEMGANKDALDLSAIAVGTGYSEQTAASAVDTGTVGILVLDATTANSANNISAANLYAAAISADTNTAAGESLFIAHTTHKTNAANVFIHKATINANNDGFDALTLVATLEGLTTTASFDTTNFTLSDS